jgi:hypothetical protein
MDGEKLNKYDLSAYCSMTDAMLCLPKVLNGLKSLIHKQGKLVQNAHGLRLADSLITAKRKCRAKKDSQNSRSADNQLNINKLDGSFLRIGNT